MEETSSPSLIHGKDLLDKRINLLFSMKLRKDNFFDVLYHSNFTYIYIQISMDDLYIYEEHF